MTRRATEGARTVALALLLMGCGSRTGLGTGRANRDASAQSSDAGAPCRAGVVVAQTTATVALAVDDRDVYWTELGTGPRSPSGIVARCGKTGCTTPEVLASKLTEPFDVEPSPTRIFFADLDGVHACDKASCSPSLITPASLTSKLAVDEQHVFFRAGDGIFSCPLGGSATPDLLASSGEDNDVSIAISGSDVFWVATHYTGGVLDQTGRVLACAKTGCNRSPRTVVSNVVYPLAVAADDHDVYVTSGEYGPDDAGAIVECPTTGCSSPVTLAGGLHHPIAVAIDVNTVYWVDQGTKAAGFTDGDVASCPKTGCPGGPTLLATGLASPSAIATDATCVYYALGPSGVGTGAILRVPK